MMSESEFDEATADTSIIILIEELGMSDHIDNIQIPKELECPISHCLMRDPVILGSTGKTFDKSTIKHCLRTKPNIDPLTNNRLESSNLLTNYSVRDLIEDFLRNNARELIDNHIKESNKSTLRA
jgi:hypothetical protein